MVRGGVPVEGSRLLAGCAERYVLAIDLGTSGAKVAVATSHGRILSHDFEPTGLCLLPGGGAEQDPAEKGGMAPVYGTAARIPVRGAVGDLLERYLDSSVSYTHLRAHETDSY